jgi:N6-adenosine-specific RNA methylase IME4
MRKIQHILANAERLKGEYDALMRCADKVTVSNWRRAIEVMGALDGSLKGTTHIQPTHAREIARNSPRENWGAWVERCEAEQLTVPALRGELLAARATTANETAEKTVPDGKYRTIVVDPPWDYGNKSGRHGVPYQTMTLERVCAFDIERWAPSDDVHLYLWVTDAYAGDVYQVTRAWGFEPKAWLVWVKDRIGMGNYFRHQHECCVFAVRGKLRLSRMNASTVFNAPVGRHSEKPDAFYSLVESCSPGPYLDVFARRHRPGWAVYGDEVSAEFQQDLLRANESPRLR